MNTAIVDVLTLEPLGHREAMHLQEQELDRTLRMLRSLDDEAWSTPTDCPAWDILAMYQHVLGACEAGASIRENIHQLRRGRAYRKHHGGPLEAALSQVQVSERTELTPTQVVERLATTAPRMVRGRRRTPGLIRNHAKMAVDGPVHETWRLGYLLDTIYLRDLWMHRVDAAHALHQPMEIETGHDGRIVANVVAEWARRHGQPFLLELSGPAGGNYVSGPVSQEDGHISLDALDFCRTLAGREPATGLLATVVPF